MTKNGQISKEKLDQYFTPQYLADEYCLNVVSKYGSDAKYVEPTAGNGVFITALIKAGVPASNITAYDLDPQDASITQMNAFDLTTELTGKVIVGNLPFGKGGSMAIKMMNHFTNQAPVAICLINPICIGHKHFAIDRLDSRLYLEDTFEFPEGTHFTYLTAKDLSKPNPVRCEFQIWSVGPARIKKVRSKRNSNLTVMSPGNTKIVDSDGRLREQGVGNINADFTIKSHGKNAGQVIDFDPAQKANVHMFIQASQSVRTALEAMDMSALTKYSTISHNPSIAPTELVEATMIINKGE